MNADTDEVECFKLDELLIFDSLLKVYLLLFRLILINKVRNDWQQDYGL